jgi:hypothetical protein
VYSTKLEGASQTGALFHEPTVNLQLMLTDGLPSTVIFLNVELTAHHSDFIKKQTSCDIRGLVICLGVASERITLCGSFHL